jgi:hypothetical protein
MITAFGMAHETGDGGIAIRDDAVRGVHLTRLKPDGTDRERGDRAKIMIGHSVGSPLVMSPPGNVGGLAITEGVEDALTLVEAVGVGAWAAGSASRLPSLADAMPSYVSTRCIFQGSICRKVDLMRSSLIVRSLASKRYPLHGITKRRSLSAQ